MTKIRQLVLVSCALAGCMSLLGGCYARVNDPGRGGYHEDRHEERHDDHERR